MNTRDGYQLLEEKHADAVHARNRFGPVVFNGAPWDLSHLRPFAFKQAISLPNGQTHEVDIVVFFSCHCFTEQAREGDQIDPTHWYQDDRETRVLNEARYLQSRELLPKITQNFATREIRTTGQPQENYMTIEITDHEGEAKPYIVFFEIKKDKKRRGRILLRIQSAYVKERLNNRLKNGQRVNFQVLVRATYQEKKI